MAAVIVSIEYAGAPAGDEALRLLCRELRGRGVRAAAVIRRDGPLYSGHTVSSGGLFDSGALCPEGPAVSDRIPCLDGPAASGCIPCLEGPAASDCIPCPEGLAVSDRVDKPSGQDALKSATAERDFTFTAVTDGEKLIASGGDFSLERIMRLWSDTDAVLVSGWYGYEFPTVDLARCAPDGGAPSGAETNGSKLYGACACEASDDKIHPGSGGEVAESSVHIGLSGGSNGDHAPVSPDACAAAAERIIELGASSDPCWLPYARLASGADSPAGGVSLSIDGSKVALLPFVQDIIRQVNLGLISALKDTGSGKRIEIVIEPK